MPISSWSTTPSDNATADSANNINWAEGMSPAQVNDSARAMMAEIKKSVASETAAGLIELATVAETLAGTDTIRAMTPAAFAGSKSLGNSGYYKFPGGLMIQWGRNVGVVTTNASGDGTWSVTWPLTFASAVYGYSFTPTNEGLAVTGAGVTANAISTAGAGVVFRGAASTQYAVSYIVLGR